MDVNNEEVEIKLTKEQYVMLIAYLYSAARFGLNSNILGGEKEEKLSDLFQFLGSFGEKFNLPNTIALFSNVSPLPISEQEFEILNKEMDAQFEEIFFTVLAQKFAELDFEDFFNDNPSDYEGGWLGDRKIVIERMQYYIKEFKENGIKNLKFKLFKKPSFEDLGGG